MFEDIPTVITASRTAQPISLSGTPVSVLTADDIHYGGFTNIAEALRYVQGIDFVRMDRNRYAIGIRGFQHDESERSLTLIDGRTAENPFSGAVDWLAMPLILEDIDRVEVVRGSGGASWGANAMNGVINIITKDPDKTLGLLSSTTVNQFGEVYQQTRWGAKDGNWSWRISTGYTGQKTSENTVNNSDFASHDFDRTIVVDTKAVYKLGDNDKISFGIGYSGTDRGYSDYIPLVGSFPSNERLDEVLYFARLDHTFHDGSTAYAQWSGFVYDTSRPNIAHALVASNSLDGQINLAKTNNNSLSFGGNLRWDNTNTTIDTPPQGDLPGVVNDYWAGAFVDDRWELTPRLTFEGQLRLDHYNETGLDWAGRIAALYALDHDKRHIVRLAAARAFRILPLRLRLDSYSGGYIYNPPGGSAINEGSWTIEAGYTGRLLDALTVHADAYYQRYSNLLGYRFDFSSFPPVIVTTSNLAGADAIGAEVGLDLKGTAGLLSIWYAYHGMSTDFSNQDIRAFFPPTNSVGATGRLFLPNDWTFNANYRYTDITHLSDEPVQGISPISASHHFDLTMAKSFHHGLGELTVGVQDLFNTTDDAADGTTTNTFRVATRTPGRTFFVRVQIKF